MHKIEKRNCKHYIYYQNIILKSEEKNPNMIYKVVTRSNYTAFPKEDIQMANRLFRKNLIALVIRRMQMQTTMRYHLSPVGMTIIKETNENKYCPGYGEKEALDYH